MMAIEKQNNSQGRIFDFFKTSKYVSALYNMILRLFFLQEISRIKVLSHEITEKSRLNHGEQKLTLNHEPKLTQLQKVRISMLSDDQQKFWNLIRNRFRQKVEIKSKKTRDFLCALGFTQGMRTESNITVPDFEGAYSWICQEWHQRFGKRLPPDRPLYEGKQISLSWLLLELIRPDEEEVIFDHLLLNTREDFEQQRECNKLLKQYYEILQETEVQRLIEEGGDLADEFVKLLHFDIGVMWPPEPKVIEGFRRVFLEILSHAEAAAEFESVDAYFKHWLQSHEEASLPLFESIACPHWSYDQKGVHTFRELLNETSFTSMHVLRGFIMMWFWFKSKDLHHFIRFKIAIADSEAYNPHNLCIVNETVESFVQKCRQSNEHFLQSLPHEMQQVTEVCLLTELLGSKKAWDQIYSNALGRVEKADWQKEHFPDFDAKAALSKAFLLREPMYRNWVTETDPEKWQNKAYALFCDQIAQNAAAGKSAKDANQYVVCFQGEFATLAPWMNVMTFEVLPVFFMRRRKPAFLRESIRQLQQKYS